MSDRNGSVYERSGLDPSQVLRLLEEELETFNESWIDYRQGDVSYYRQIDTYCRLVDTWLSVNGFKSGRYR